MDDQKPTNQEIFDLLQKTSSDVKTIKQTLGEHEGHFGSIKQTLGEHEGHFGSIKQTLGEHGGYFDSIKQTLGEHEGYFESIKESFSEIEQKIDALASKDELNSMEQRINKRFDKIDEKIAETRGDLVGMLRKEDTKVVTLATKLGTRNILSMPDIQEVLAMEPFPVGK